MRGRLPAAECLPGATPRAPRSAPARRPDLGALRLARSRGVSDAVTRKALASPRRRHAGRVRASPRRLRVAPARRESRARDRLSQGSDLTRSSSLEFAFSLGRGADDDRATVARDGPRERQGRRPPWREPAVSSSVDAPVRPLPVHRACVVRRARAGRARTGVLASGRRRCQRRASSRCNTVLTLASLGPRARSRCSRRVRLSQTEDRRGRCAASGGAVRCCLGDGRGSRPRAACAAPSCATFSRCLALAFLPIRQS